MGPLGSARREPGGEAGELLAPVCEQQAPRRARHSPADSPTTSAGPGSRTTVSRRNGNSSIAFAISDSAKKGAGAPSGSGRWRGRRSRSRCASLDSHATPTAS
jgi:hypothetical protein